jgi:hypothetical protein
VDLLAPGYHFVEKEGEGSVDFDGFMERGTEKGEEGAVI